MRFWRTIGGLVLGAVALPGTAWAVPDTPTAPSPTNTAPVISWDDQTDATDWRVLRNAKDAACDSGTAAVIAASATSPYTDSSLAADGTDDGAYCYFVESLDGSAPGPSALGVVVTFDTTAPSAVAFVSPPSQNTRVNATTDLAATASDALSGIDDVQLQRDDGTPAWDDIGAPDQTAPFGDVDFLIAGLIDGAHDLRLLATDAAGNTATSSTLTLIVDTVTQAPVISAPAAASHHAGTIAIAFSNGDGAGVTSVAEARQGTDPFASQAGLGTSSWNTLTGPVADGVWEIRITSTDNLGNPAASDTVTVTVDNADPPAPTLSAPAASAIVRGTVSVSSTTSSDALSGPTTHVIEASSGGAFSIRAGLTLASWDTTQVADGLWSLRIRSTDAVGNESSVTVAGIRVDNTLPSPPAFGAAPASNTQLGGPINLTFQAPTDAGSGVQRVELQTRPTGTTGAWAVRATDLSSPFTTVSWTPGVNDDCLACDFRLVAYDLAGNAAASGSRTNIRIDNFAPPAPTAFTAPQATGTAPALTWVASPPTDVVRYDVYRDDVLHGQTATASYTDTTLALDGSVDGVYRYRVKAIDAGGLESGFTAQVFVALDTRAPSAPTGAGRALHATLQQVAVSWNADSVDPAPPSGAMPTGIAGYVVRRAVGSAAPGVSGGTVVCQVLDSVESCTDTTVAEQTTYTYAVFAVDEAGNASAAATTAPIAVPDRTLPGAPAAFKVVRKGLVLSLSWTKPGDADLVRIVVRRSRTRPSSPTSGSAVYSGTGAKATFRQAQATTYWYRAFAVDDAGNVRASTAVRIAIPRFRLFPVDGSDVRGTPRLTWRRAAGASYYNIQIYAGSKKIAEAWPSGASYRVSKRRLKRGTTYTWYVWPGRGAKSAGRYGRLIGKSTFTWRG